MLLIDAITSLDHQRVAGTARTTLRAEAPYFAEGRFKKHWLIELAAQASAAISQATRADGEGKSLFGYLISVRQFQMKPDLELAPGDELGFEVVFDVQMAPVGQSRTIVTLKDVIVGEGIMTFFREE